VADGLCESSVGGLCSFDPRAPEGLQLFVKRIERDDKFILEMEAEVNKFLDEMNERIEKLNQLKERNG